MDSQDDAIVLHIVMFPWLAFGHMLPYLELAKSLARKGHRVSFISTPRNIQRLPKIPPNLVHFIKFVELQLLQVEHLPHKAEATSDLPVEKVPYLKKAYDGLESSLVNFLETCSPDWIISDFVSHWLPPAAAKLDIPCAFFSIFNASVLSFVGPPSSSLSFTEPARVKPKDFTVPPSWISFNNNLTLRMYEAMRMCQHFEENEAGVSDVFRLTSVVDSSDIIVVRSCNEIESELLKFLQDELYKKPVLPIGLLPSQLQTENEEDEKWLEIKMWLDRHVDRSVVYIAFGTEATLTQDETTELAHGLELSQLPFFWVLKRPAGSVDDSSILPNGFEDRTKGRGFIYRNWAPQLKILSHPSIGVFLTHSGWSSVIESLRFGCPLVLFPIMNDQTIVARMLVSKQIALEIPRNELDGSFVKETVAATLRMVMFDEKGQVCRSKAVELRDVSSDGGINDYIDYFERYLKEHTHNNEVK